MKPIHDNVIIKQEAPEYTGVITGVASGESAYGRVLGIGDKVTLVNLNDKVIVNWKECKSIGGSAFLIEESKILGILESE